jgi:hypothetical protein
MTNSSGLAIFVRLTRVHYNRGLTCEVKCTFCPENLFVITECLLITEFVITEFHCFSILLYFTVKPTNRIHLYSITTIFGSHFPSCYYQVLMNDHLSTTAAILGFHVWLVHRFDCIGIADSS